MFHPNTSAAVTLSLAVAMTSVLAGNVASAQTHAAAGASPRANAVLVELFTSEGCSSCPPADELLHEVSGQKTRNGQLIVGISEHVSYWDRLGWRDPYSSDQYTRRQSEYSAHLGLEGVYTPQMVVNGREQLVGSDRRALETAFAAEFQRPQIELRILSAMVTAKAITFTYAAASLPANGSVELVAVLVDDSDRSQVLRGENSGRTLTHTSVARALAPLGALHAAEQKSISLPLPPSFMASPRGAHHLILFAQQTGAGPVLGVDTRPF